MEAIANRLLSKTSDQLYRRNIEKESVIHCFIDKCLFRHSSAVFIRLIQRTCTTSTLIRDLEMKTFATAIQSRAIQSPSYSLFFSKIIEKLLIYSYLSIRNRTLDRNAPPILFFWLSPFTNTNSYLRCVYFIHTRRVYLNKLG